MLSVGGGLLCGEWRLQRCGWAPKEGVVGAAAVWNGETCQVGMSNPAAEELWVQLTWEIIKL